MKIEQKYIMLIMSCQRYQKKASYQKMTWLRSLPAHLRYYHVMGDEEMDADYRFDEPNKILWIKVKDDYVSLPKKVIRAYNVISERFQFEYLFKTDDDQILQNERFLQVVMGLTTRVEKVHYGGQIVRIKDHLSQYHKIHPELPPNLPMKETDYCSGRFYFLSDDAVHDLLKKQANIEAEYFEDYAIGYNLSPEYKYNMMNLQTPKFFLDIEHTDFPQLLKENKI